MKSRDVVDMIWFDGEIHVVEELRKNDDTILDYTVPTD